MEEDEAQRVTLGWTTQSDFFYTSSKHNLPNHKQILGQSVEKNKQVVNCSGIIFRSGRP